MWIASKYGFYSIVRKDGHYHIRARKEKDLQELITIADIDFPIETWRSADYRFRVRIPETDHVSISTVFQALMESVTYPNFKSEIAANTPQRDKLDTYHEIWHLLAQHQT